MWMVTLLALWGCTGTVDERGCAKVSGDLPDGLLVPELLSVDESRSEMWQGHLLATQGATTTWVVAYDRCAVPVWWRPSQSETTKITRVHMGRDRRSVLYSEFDESREEDVGRIQRVNLSDGRVTITRAREQHHDFFELPDGDLAWLSWERRPNEWFENSDQTELLADAILSAPEGIGEGVEPDVRYSTFDDLDVEPFWSCSHMQGGWANGLDWTHTNSLIFHDDTEEWTINMRQWDATLRLNPDGSLKWMVGGPLDGFTRTEGTRWQRHGHMSDAWSDRLLIFDNGNHGDDPIVSRAVEYRVDEAAGTLEQVWSFDHPDGGYVTHLGDARRLPGGNTMVSWSPDGILTEVTPEGDIVWEARVDQKIGRVEFVPDWPGGL